MYMNTNYNPAFIGNTQINSLNSLSTFVEEVVNKKINEIEHKSHINVITECIKFFKLDYATGKNILDLCNSENVNDHLIGINCLFNEIKDKLKEEIIKELKQNG